MRARPVEVQSKYFLTEREKKILDYIREHDGLWVNQLRHAVSSYSSSQTTLNVVDKLTKLKLILQKSSKEHRQKKRLYINTQNYFILVQQSIEQFENFFFPFLHNTIANYLTHSRNSKGADANRLLVTLFEIFFKSIDALTFHYTVSIRRQHHFPGWILFNEIILLVFKKISEWQMRLVKIYTEKIAKLDESDGNKLFALIMEKGNSLLRSFTTYQGSIELSRSLDLEEDFKLLELSLKGIFTLELVTV